MAKTFPGLCGRAGEEEDLLVFLLVFKERERESLRERESFIRNYGP